MFPMKTMSFQYLLSNHYSLLTVSALTFGVFSGLASQIEVLYLLGSVLIDLTLTL